MNRLIIGVGVVAVLLGGGFVFFISHTFTRPLGDLGTGVRRRAGPEGGRVQ